MRIRRYRSICALIQVSAASICVLRCINGFAFRVSTQFGFAINPNLVVCKGRRRASFTPLAKNILLCKSDAVSIPGLTLATFGALIITYRCTISFLHTGARCVCSQFHLCSHFRWLRRHDEHGCFSGRIGIFARELAGPYK